MNARSLLVSIALLAGVALPAHAQPPAVGFRTEVAVGLGARLGADLKDAPGDYAATRTSLEVELGGSPAGTSDRWTATLGGRWEEPDFGGPVAWFDSTRVFDVGGTWQRRIDDRWGVQVAAELQWGAEDDASLGDGLHWGGRVMARRQVSEAWAVSFGGMVFSQLEDDTRVLPMIALEWRASERLTVFTANGIRGIYLLDPRGGAMLDFGVTWEARQFRLADRPGRTDAALDHSEVPVSLGYTRRYAGGFQWRIAAEFVAWSEFEVRRDGAKLAETELDPGFGLAFRAGWSF